MDSLGIFNAHTNERYLIVGGCGFVGRHIVEQLMEASAPSIAVFDIQQRFFDKEVTYFTGDITDATDLEGIFQNAKPTIIIHTASPIPGTHSEDVMWHVNVNGTKNLLNVSKRHGVKKFVYTSSSSVIFDGRDLKNANESIPYPQTHMDTYNETKAIAEQAVLKADDPSNEFYTVVLRPSGIFGEGDRQSIPGFMKVFEDGKTRMQIGNNSNLNDFTYVGNVAQAHILAAQKANESKVHGQVFIITNDEPIYWWDFPRAIWAEMDHEPQGVIIIPRSVGMTIGFISEMISMCTGKPALITRFRVTFTCVNRYFNISKAKTYLGYEPKTSLHEGIRRSVKWWKETQMKR